MTGAFWTSAFLDLAPADLDRGAAFWAAVTGYDATQVGDPEREFPPLRPPAGAPYLWVQRIAAPPSRVHVDLHVTDLEASVREAERLGAELLVRRDHAVLRSPGGFVFCLVTDPTGDVPGDALWPEGHASRVDRVQVLVPAASFREDLALWNALRPPTPRGLTLVVDRGADPAPWAVLEVGTTDPDREVARHVALGATVVERGAAHDELRDPVGIRYRVRDRSR